jgi:exopolysaccharide production protein ExoZ
MENSTRFNRIQTLRFLAAVIVMAGHVLIFASQKVSLPPDVIEFVSWCGGGWAVSLFFCISGFVITHAAQRLSAGDFLAQRLLRIYPGYLVAVATVFLVKLAIWGSIPPGHFTFAAMSLAPVGHINYPLGVEWTLIFELFFYALFSLVWIGRSNAVLVLSAALWLAAIVAAAILRPEWASDRFPTWSTVFFSARNLPFIFGIFAYFLYQRVTPAVRHLLYPLVPAGAFGITFFTSTAAIIGSLSVSVFAFLLLVAGTARLSDARSDSVLVQYGNYSYGLYLIHLPLVDILLAATSLGQKNALLVVVVLGFTALCGGLLFGAAENALYHWLKSRYLSLSSRRRMAPGVGKSTADVGTLRP